METQDENDALFGRDHGIRAEITKLLAAQSQEIVRLNSPGIQPPVVKVGAAEAVVMSPYVVRDTKVPIITDSVYMPPLLQILDDGTLFHKVGTKVTTNIVLHPYTVTPQLAGGNMRPRSGVEVGFFWSW